MTTISRGHEWFTSDGFRADFFIVMRRTERRVAVRIEELPRRGISRRLARGTESRNGAGVNLRAVWVALVVALLPACTAVDDPPTIAIAVLPGAEAFSSELHIRLAKALAAPGTGHPPHTRHVHPDGSPRYTNRLVLEASPYLLQHAHNPVNWYPWGDEAFATAAKLGRPVLLSVGYSTCHWCHVMEEESFEDEEIARYLNAHYVAIKVDREVRPDVDEAYMSVVQALTGGGGWPMTVWLTPDRKPFYGGTYFPPRDGARGAGVGFLTVLQRLHDTFATQPLEIATQATRIVEHVRQRAAGAPGAELPGSATMHAAYERWSKGFDAVNGGFYGAPKFPMPPVLEFLLRYYRRTGNAHALEMVTLTLERMADGGLQDQIGGGFHRYATDAAWQVPHFEKMLYDNAQLARLYVAAYQVTKREPFARVARDVLDYVAREMTAPGGGFYGATDADSEGEEGRFFLWTPAEVRAALDGPQAEAVLAYYAVSESGNFAGRNILHVARPLADVAASLGTTPETLAQRLAAARSRLYAVRQRRVPPHTDTKILAGWNGLMISAFARAGAAFNDAAYVEHARAAARFALDHLRREGRLQRSWIDGAAHEDAFLDDYAYLAAGLLDLYEATFDLAWLRAAIELQETLARDFWDTAHGAFFLTDAAREVTLARAKPDNDGALPSGNAVAIEGLLRLGELTGDDRWRARADRALQALAPQVERAPALLAALDFRLDRPKEIVIVRPTAAGGGADALLATVRATYLPNRALTVVTEGAELARQRELIPLVGGKEAIDRAATAYVCEQRVCARPTSDPSVLAAQLARVAPLPDS
jgi:uncharacterized protein YyaL (SSP411 family)